MALHAAASRCKREFDPQAQAVARQQALLRQLLPAGQLAAAAPAAECPSRSGVMRDLRHTIAVQDGKRVASVHCLAQAQAVEAHCRRAQYSSSSVGRNRCSL